MILNNRSRKEKNANSHNHLRPAKEVIENVDESEREWVKKECNGSRPERESGAEASEQTHDNANYQNHEHL